MKTATTLLAVLALTLSASATDWTEQAITDAAHDKTEIIFDGHTPDRLAFDDNRHRAVYVGAKLPPLL